MGGTVRRCTTPSRSRLSSGRIWSETRHRNVEVELESDLCRGRTVVDLWNRSDRAPNAHVGISLDSDAFFELLVGRIATLG